MSGTKYQMHFDEEEVLPFPVFIAELELLVGNSKRGKPDGVQLLELLQKLLATIPRTDKAVVKQHQRQCEAMLYDVLAHGIGAAVRRLIFDCFCSLYAHGDSISIYTRVNSLQTYLSSKEGMSRSTAEDIRVGLLDLLAHLYGAYGRMLANSALESVNIASRTVSKSGNQTAVRCAALRLAGAAVRGLNPLDRSAPAVQGEAWNLLQRNAKDRTTEEAVRDAAFRALGELASASRSAAAAEALSAEKRPAKKAAAERVVSGCVRAALVAPLIDAALHGRREACLGMSGAWMAYVGSLARHRAGHDHTADLMEVAAVLVGAVGEAGRMSAEARAASAPEQHLELGAGLAGGELPALQACALYVLRRGVMCALAEAGQRKLLERLANTLDKRLATPAAVVTLEALATLLEAVGEVPDDTAVTLERLLQPYVTSASSATRQQAAVALASLAAAHPAAAARMLSGCLDTVASCAGQMAAPLSPVAAASNLSAASADANGGLPHRRALALAEDLVTGPGPDVAANRAICREVGFLLLGSLCALGVPQAGRGPEAMAALWAGALGEGGRRELDERAFARPGGELDLALHLRAPGGRIAPGSGPVAVLAKACLRPFRSGLLPGTRLRTRSGHTPPMGLEPSLLTAQLVLLGRLVAASPVLQQLQILDVVHNAVQASKTLARQSRDASACRRLPLAVAAAVMLLAGYGAAAVAARRSKSPLDPTDKVSDKLLSMAQALMPDEHALATDAAPLSRAAVEAFAASAAAGTDAWAARVGAVSDSVDALVAAASRPGSNIAAAWVLHALWLVACNSGGAFVPRVRTVLQLGQELLVSSFESPALRAACARLANASVLVLGPEFTLGSAAYTRAKCLVAASGGKAVRSVREVLTAPHLRTRHFAADCLLRLVRVCVAEDEGHRDSSLLERLGAGGSSRSTGSLQGAGEWADSGTPAAAASASLLQDPLILKLQTLVDVGFKLATIPLESLRPHGVRLLTLLVQLFGDVADPLLAGARLMEQYQAQIAGGVLATTFLESGLAAGDAVVMRRLMELLSAPLAPEAWPALRYEPYAEWVGARVRVELLRAHAQCAAIAAAAAARGDALCAGIVAKAHEPHAARLQAAWALLLQEHAVLCSQHDAVLAAYHSPLLDGEDLADPAAAASGTGTLGYTSSSAGNGNIGSSFAEIEEADAANGEGAVVGQAAGSGGVLTPALAAVLRPFHRLLEVALMLLTDASARLAHAVAAALRSAGPAGGIDLASLPPGAGAAAAAAASMWSSASPRVGASHHHGGGNADGSFAHAPAALAGLLPGLALPCCAMRAASNGPAGSSGRGEGNGQGQGQGLPPWMGPLGEAAGGLAAAPGCLPLPAPAPEQATALAQCTAQALGAAQLLLRRCPWSALQPHVGPLLELPLRLLLTCASGAAVAPAAAGKAAGPEPEAALVQSRLATLAAACLGCGAALSAAEQQPPRPAVAAARGTVVAALTAPLAPEVPPAAALAVLEAARGAVQESVAEDAASARGRWARLLVAALVGPAVVRVGPLLTEAKAPLSGEEQSMVGEAIKLLVLASTLAAAQGQPAQEGVMQTWNELAALLMHCY
eukprot:XP_001692082.1 predicted protein [Chlamydomonas reinhardtii]